MIPVSSYTRHNAQTNELREIVYEPPQSIDFDSVACQISKKFINDESIGDLDPLVRWLSNTPPVRKYSPI